MESETSLQQQANPTLRTTIVKQCRYKRHPRARPVTEKSWIGAGRRGERVERTFENRGVQRTTKRTCYIENVMVVTPCQPEPKLRRCGGGRMRRTITRPPLMNSGAPRRIELLANPCSKTKQTTTATEVTGPIGKAAPAASRCHHVGGFSPGLWCVFRMRESLI
jgi:hypothetical protein